MIVERVRGREVSSFRNPVLSAKLSQTPDSDDISDKEDPKKKIDRKGKREKDQKRKLGLMWKGRGPYPRHKAFVYLQGETKIYRSAE